MSNVVETALIGVALVVLTDEDNRKYSFTTATEVTFQTRIKEGEKIPLVIKNVLKAQKNYKDVILGIDIKFKDNMFLPEVVELLQGGVAQMKAEGQFERYAPPAAGVEYESKRFTVDVYSEHIDTSSQILGYAKFSFPNGQGKPIEMASKDGEFFAPEYTVITAPLKGQPPYTIEYVDTLPVI